MAAPIDVDEIAPNHFCPRQTHPDITFVTKSLPWYTAKYAPHNVPAFYDVSGLVENRDSFRKIVDLLVNRYSDQISKGIGPTCVAGFEALGFVFGPTVAFLLSLPFILIRKKGKLPGVVVQSGTYGTEYSVDEMAIRITSVQPGARVLLIDDLIATGGTALAGFKMFESVKAEIHEFVAIIALPTFKGVKKIHKVHHRKYAGIPIFTIIDAKYIGKDQCSDPPEGTPYVVGVEKAAKLATKLWKYKLAVVVPDSSSGSGSGSNLAHSRICSSFF